MPLPSRTQQVGWLVLLTLLVLWVLARVTGLA
jgi:hypothetical protein